MSFAQNLEKIMINNKCTKYKLAKMLGVHQTTIKNWLDGKTEPKIETINQLASIFNVPITDFFNVQDDATIYATKEFLKLLNINSEQKIIEPSKERKAKPPKKKEVTPEEKAIDIPIIDFESTYLKKLSCSFHKLNVIGKNEALKRVEELTEIPKYTTPDPPDDTNKE